MYVSRREDRAGSSSCQVAAANSFAFTTAVLRPPKARAAKFWGARWLYALERLRNNEHWLRVIWWEKVRERRRGDKKKERVRESNLHAGALCVLLAHAAQCKREGCVEKKGEKTT